ncbi:hypothetical protein LCGC14_2349000, partial [marine sediment metagenome]
VSSYQFYQLYLARTVHTAYSQPGDEDWFIHHAYDALKWGALLQGSVYLRDREFAKTVNELYRNATRDAIASDIEAETSASSLWVGT